MGKTEDKNILRGGGLSTKALYAAFITAAFGTLFFSYVLFAIQVPRARSAESVSFKIVRGEGLRVIARNLEQRRLIRSPLAFEIYAWWKRYAGALQSGVYILSPSMPAARIAYLVHEGKAREVKVVIPEGFTLKDIEQRLEEAGVLVSQHFSDGSPADFSGRYIFLEGAESFEGYLFPDTYHFFLEEDAGRIREAFLENFGRKAEGIFSEAARERLKNYTQSFVRSHDVIVMASLVEKEIIDYEDRRIVSGILWKRLRAEMPLQVDATISYAKCAGKILRCADRKVTRSDLAFESPYNTYLNSGLPPGPISNPGVESLSAAADPLGSDYWYYLSDPKTGKTIFSVTLEEHNTARARYLGL